MKIRNVVTGVCLAFLLCGAESVLYNRTLRVAACHTLCSYTIPCISGCSAVEDPEFDGKECCYVNQEEHPTCQKCYVRYRYTQKCEDPPFLCPAKIIYIGIFGSGASSCCCCYTGASWVCGHPCTGQCDGDVLYKSTCP